MIRRKSHSTVAAQTPMNRRRRRRLFIRSSVALGATVSSLLGAGALALGPVSASASPSQAAVSIPALAVANTTATPPTGCPIALPAPTSTAGIGAVYPLIPIFGPFSSEAFVWLPLLQTLVPSTAPLLPLLQDTLVGLQPELNELLPILENLEASGYAVIGPQYAPYRQQVLSAEQQLVSLLLPLAQQGAALPGASCLAPIEGVIVSGLDLSAAAGTLG
jgi:hypothetical protein